MVFFILVGAIFCAVLGAALGSSKGRGAAGFFLGFLFGPIGIAIALLLPSKLGADASDDKADALRPCPFCAEPIRPAALKCRFCSSDLPDSFRAVQQAPVVTDPGLLGRLDSNLAAIEHGQVPYETYEEVMGALNGSITAKGFLTSMHYVIDHDGKQSRVDRFEDLRGWFLNNIVSRARALDAYSKSA